MAYTLTMPEVGETVTEGTIEKWLKQPGDKIEKYDPIVEINTDKVNVELPSPVSGMMKEIIAKEGETVPIGAPLATIDEVAGETPADISPPRPTETEGSGEPPARDPVAARRSNGHSGAREPHRATPRVRKVAAELGVDLAQISGSGPGGRIVEEDVRAFAKGGAAAAVAERPAGTKQPPGPAVRPIKPGADEEAVPLTAIRKTIAARMTQSAAVPTAWLVTECDVTDLVKLRQAKKEAFKERHGVDLTYLPFAAHAVAQALLDHPYLNASWGEDKIIFKKRVHLGIAVATERGLLVPNIRDADRLSVTGLALAMTEAGEKARTNKLQLDDVQGGTFTLDNTGAFGSTTSYPIINAGQSAIITFEVIQKKPAVVGENAIGVRSLVNMCLAFDHRVLDGHQAGAFLNDVKKRMEAYGPETGLD
jgi:2-oxoisovalerate dehydrogenase E2 component (dihydrolipoyl transacylase)